MIEFLSEMCLPIKKEFVISPLLRE